MDTDLLRIIDANLNRAREALRTIEDYARFALDDADAAIAGKRARHDLQTIVARLGADNLLAARDIDGDVGRDAKTSRELNRTTAESVLRAAFGRLTEALRTIGEWAKLENPDVAAVAEHSRYAAYELEQRILLRGDLRARFRDVRAYVLLTSALCRRDWFETAEMALCGGAGCLQLREKDLDGAELLARARRLRELTRAHNALLAINDRPDIARLCNADIVHVGQSDLSVRDVRRIAGTEVLVGKSTHTPEQFEAALAESSDYIAIGPMFATDTKPQERIAGVETLRTLAPRTELPVVAIGGITAQNVAKIAPAGANCVAVCAAVLGSDDPEAATRALVTEMEKARA